MWEIHALFSYTGYEEDFVCLNYYDIRKMMIPKGVLLHILYRSKNCKFSPNMYIKMTHNDISIDSKSTLTIPEFLQIRHEPTYERVFYFGGHHYTSRGLGMAKGKHRLPVDELAKYLRLGGVSQKWKLLMFDTCSFLNKANVRALNGLTEYLIGFENEVGDHGLIITGKRLRNNVFSYFDQKNVLGIFRKFKAHKDVIGEPNHLHLIKYTDSDKRGYQVVETVEFNKEAHNHQKAVFAIGGEYGSLSGESPYITLPK